MFPLYDTNPTTRRPLVTVALIALNVLVLLGMSRMDLVRRQLFVVEHGFIPARIAQLSTGEPLEVVEPLQGVDRRTGHLVTIEQQYRLPADKGGILASLLTCMFIHGGWMHLIGNMWFLWIFGDNIEDRLGHVPYLIFYLAGGLAAMAGHWILNPQSTLPVVGASGAVAAVLGAYAVTYPHAHVRTLVVLVIFFTFWDLPALAVLGMWFVLQLVEARNAVNLHIDGGVAFAAHVAGFAMGAVVMPLARAIIPPPPAPPPEPQAAVPYGDSRFY